MKLTEVADYQLVNCAVCGDPNGLHIVGVRVDKLGDLDYITPTGIKRYTKAKEARGSMVDIDFRCEQGGHMFSVRFEFHKGQVLVRTMDSPVKPPTNDSEEFEELPRD